MEDIFKTLSPDQQEWLADHIQNGNNIKDYVRELLVEDYQRQNPGAPV
ncbi:hypothetical protein HYP85_gp057 [Pseudomonas phage Zuri]|uniref:RIIB-like protein n=1 Tax=Pseudomonas phage Zuri TaxID=2604899 RepID=A0A5C1K6X2_9CAUD|nr:hypothetical protein HYP85_gp057 [Pseudomonas phage Zuri]QEM41154.1 rIIB-like protein [Pseudomonas phage Zuri]